MHRVDVRDDAATRLVVIDGGAVDPALRQQLCIDDRLHDEPEDPLRDIVNLAACIQLLLPWALARHLRAVCVALTEEVLAAQRRAVDSVLLVFASVGTFYSAVDLALDCAALGVAEERHLLDVVSDAARDLIPLRRRHAVVDGPWCRQVTVVVPVTVVIIVRR